MIEKYEVQARSRRRKASVVKKRRSTKRRSTKRRSTKRRSTKRRSTKRRSRFGANETLLERINNIAEEDEEEDVPPIRTRDSTERKRIENTIIKVQTAEAALAEAVEARAKAEAALAKADEALGEANEARAKAEALANEAPPPLPPLPHIRPVSKWGVPGDRGPAPPPTERKRADPGLQIPDNEKSAARAAASAKGFQEGVLKLVENIKVLGGKTTFGKLFNEYEHVSDSLNGFLISARKQKLIKYDGGILFQGKDNDVVITVI